MEHPGSARRGNTVVHHQVGRRGSSAMHQVPQKTVPAERGTGGLQLCVVVAAGLLTSDTLIVLGFCVASCFRTGMGVCQGMAAATDAS